MDSITQSGMIGLAKISVTTCKPLYETELDTQRQAVSVSQDARVR